MRHNMTFLLSYTYFVRSGVRALEFPVSDLPRAVFEGVMYKPITADSRLRAINSVHIAKAHVGKFYDRPNLGKWIRGFGRD